MATISSRSVGTGRHGSANRSPAASTSCATGGAAVVLAAEFVPAEARTASAPGQPVTAAVALVALLGALLALGRRPGHGELVAPAEQTRARPSARPAAFGVATLAFAVAAGGLVVPDLPGLRTTPARLARRAPVRPSEPLTPTATMVELRDRAVRPLFRVVFDHPTTGYLSVASLDAYNGASWSFDRLFEPSGGRVPPAPAAPVGHRVLQRYRILTDLGMPWMPYLDPPADVGGVAIDASGSAMVMPASPLRPGARFTVVSDPSGVRLARARGGALAAGPGAPPSPEDLAVPPAEEKDLTGLTRQLAAVTHTSTAAPLAFLRAAEADLAAHGRTVPPRRGARRWGCRRSRASPWRK